MRKIAVLDQNTIDKIAAGEVVERPSSVVKELVENAIDAGATAVTVEITDGGKKLIRITDNGSGMEADQIPLAFLRHATSKIEKVEDLESIASLGFRGEALSSIAAVSQVELITKTPSGMTGSRYIIEGGREHSLEEMGAPDGTTFLVRNLFYNTPARSKFLKSDMTEGNYITGLMEQLALSHPEISFKYIQNKQVKLHTSGNYNVKDVIYHIYGREITRALMELQYENDFMKITGFAGKPEISRGNRAFENYYINGRYVKNNIITKAIEDAYRGFLMQHKFPFISLHMEMEGNDLDVNVHPAKREVRFAREAEVYDGVFTAVRQALTRREMIPQVSVGKDEKKPLQIQKPQVRPAQIPEPFEKKRMSAFTKEEEALFQGSLKENRVMEVSGGYPEEKKAPDTTAERKMTPEKKPETAAEREMTPERAPDIAAEREMTPKKAPDTEVSREPVQAEAISEPEAVQEKSQEIVLKQEPVDAEVPEAVSVQEPEQAREPEMQSGQEKQLELFEEKLLSPKSRSRHQLIGQIFDTYWLVQFEDKFYIIDQHAAHEKVYYERFVKQFQAREIQSQYVSPPLIVTLNLQEETLLQANRDYFQEFGFEIEHFGGKEYAISAVPSNLYGFREEELFLEMLDHLAGEGDKNAFDLFAARLATMACKAAVKGNHRMSPAEADKLIDELLGLENPYHCPHGRPTIISMTKTELEKKFKRIV